MSGRVRSISQSKRARADIINHFARFADRNPVAADRFRAGLIRSFNTIRQFPLIGSQKFWGNSSLLSVRAWPVHRFNSYIIYYRLIGDSRIRIERVVHGAVDIAGPLRTPV